MYTAHNACAINISEHRRIDKVSERRNVDIRMERDRNRHTVNVALFVDDLGLRLVKSPADPVPRRRLEFRGRRHETASRLPGQVRLRVPHRLHATVLQLMRPAQSWNRHHSHHRLHAHRPRHLLASVFNLPASAGCVNTLSCCGKAVAVRHWPSRRSGRAASSVLARRRSLQCVYTLVVWMSVWPMMAVRSSSLAPAAASSVASQCRAL